MALIYFKIIKKSGQIIKLSAKIPKHKISQNGHLVTLVPMSQLLLISSPIVRSACSSLSSLHQNANHGPLYKHEQVMNQYPGPPRDQRFVQLPIKPVDATTEQHEPLDKMCESKHCVHTDSVDKHSVHPDIMEHR